MAWHTTAIHAVRHPPRSGRFHAKPQAQLQEVTRQAVCWMEMPKADAVSYGTLAKRDHRAVIQDLTFPDRFHVYHDESWVGRQWFYTGMLWVESGFQTGLVRELARVRARHGYYGEIHFACLSKRYVELATAKEWLRLFVDNKIPGVKFYAYGVHRGHPRYEARRFGKDFHEYNRHTFQALWNSYRLFYKDDRDSTISLFSDEKAREGRRGRDSVGNGIETDNFEAYLIRRFLTKRTEEFNLGARRMDGSQGMPATCAVRRVSVLSPSRPDAPEGIVEEHELLQLCDLLLGSVKQAVACTSQAAPKFEMGKLACALVREQNTRPMERRFQTFGRFRLAWFPDDAGLIYSNIPVHRNYGRVPSLANY